jgi:hypothetical protein
MNIFKYEMFTFWLPEFSLDWLAENGKLFRLFVIDIFRYRIEIKLYKR